MRAEIQFIFLPYDANSERTLLHVLIDELRGESWQVFRAAVGFAKQSGNYEDLLDAMAVFIEHGGTVELTFGADVFGRRAFGSDYEAVETLLTRLARSDRFRVHLYHERGRTFHPKLYLFANEPEQRAVVILGSSNWSHGGFIDNVEANVLVWLDLREAEHRRCYEVLVRLFETFWKEA